MASAEPLSRSSSKGGSILLHPHDWDPTTRLPEEPAAVSELRETVPSSYGHDGFGGLHDSDPFRMAGGPSYATAHSTGGAPTVADERLARMMLALDEHERRDPRSRQARREASFYASLRLMLREASQTSGPARTQLIAQLEHWFETERPRPRGTDVDLSRPPSRPDSRMSTAGAAGAAAGPSAEERAAERRAAGLARLQQAAPYTAYDVSPGLAPYRRRDLYSSFAHREGVAEKEAIPPGNRVVPGSRAPDDTPKSPFAHYRVASEAATAQAELAMDARWVQRRRAEAVEAADTEHMAHVVDRWAVERARAEGESVRRREAAVHGSQGGSAFHAQPQSVDAQLAARANSQLRLADASSDDDSDEGDAAGGQGGGHAASGGAGGGSADAPGGQSRRRSFLTGTNLRAEHPRVLLSDRHATVEREADGGAVSLSVFANAELAVETRARRQRPTSAQQLHRAGAPARQAFVLDLPTAPARDASLHPSGARTARAARPITAPSARRIMQLNECRRIKEAFDRRGLRLEPAVLERALLLPEDLPEEVCLSALPSMRSRAVDVDAPTRRKKGKKGKKKGKGKGKGRAKSAKRK